MILPPPELILGVLFFICMGLFILWSNRHGMRPYYESLDSLKRYFPGTLDTKKKFWADLPTFVGQYSGYQFTVIYGRPGEFGSPNKLWLYCRKLDQTGQTATEDLKRRQHQQIISDGWTYASHNNNELRAHRDFKLPLDPEMIKRTLENLTAAERGDIKTSPSTMVELETDKLGNRAKKRKAALLHAVINVFIIGLVYSQIGGGIFAHIIAALLIVESAGFIIYTLKFKK
ncbi:MAG: hypothetical protein HZC48_05410 [Nitrospirae bacterium]|nr:hypothetical protein [Nitrospirota bacterium]